MTEAASNVPHREDVYWYHSIELPDGSVTPGEYDLRGALKHIPFPADLSGKRCLDVGTRDGFWAFEMERRGAAEVVGIDVADIADLDWPQPPRVLDEPTRANVAKRATTFDTARALLGSNVRREFVSVYDLTPERVGTFDFAFVGTILLHLRDPIGALTAVAGVTRGELLVNEPVSLSLSLLRRRSPTASLLSFDDPFWWMPNQAALRRYVVAAGFDVLDQGRPYRIRGTPHLKASKPRRLRGAGGLREYLVSRYGAPHAWITARPTAPP